MTTSTADPPHAHLGQTRGAQDHDHDLVHFPIQRLDALWRSVQCFTSPEGDARLQAFWRAIRTLEFANVQHAPELVTAEVKKDCS